MKVLYLIPHSPSTAGFDSLSAFIEYAAYHRKVCHALIKRGIEVKIATLSRTSTTRETIAGIPVETYEVTAGSSFGWELSAGLLRRLRNEMEADVVHLHGYNQPNAVPYLAAVVRQYPTIVQNHGSALDQDAFKYNLWYRLVIPFLQRCVAVLSVDRDELDNLSPLIDGRTTLHHLPNAVDPDQFKPSATDAVRREIGLDPDARYGLFVGRLTPEKGVEYLLEALANLESATELTLLLVYSGGSDEQIRTIEQRIAALGLEGRVNMVGSVEHDRMPLYYNAADFCVFPSVSEGFGVVVLEAMACGTPVIASEEHLGGGHVVDGENCLVIDPQSPTEIADAMYQLLNDATRRQRLGERGRETVLEQYTYDAVIDDLLEIYRGAVD